MGVGSRERDTESVMRMSRVSDREREREISAFPHVKVWKRRDYFARTYLMYVVYSDL